MYTLYYSPGSASMVVHFALLELGVPHELRLVDLDARANKDPDYLRLNPNGLVPTLIVDGAPVFECAALLLLLGERHPGATLTLVITRQSQVTKVARSTCSGSCIWPTR